MSQPLFGLIDDAGANVMILMDGLHAEDLRRSRVTRQEVKRQLLNMADSLGKLQSSLQQQLPELDWDAWSTIVRHLHSDHLEDDALWFAASALTPATLMWLRVYRER
ncbi:MAG: hypothetical protein AB7T07_02535 [Steroidobacteraceae bacterium]